MRLTSSRKRRKSWGSVWPPTDSETAMARDWARHPTFKSIPAVMYLAAPPTRTVHLYVDRPRRFSAGRRPMWLRWLMSAWKDFRKRKLTWRIHLKNESQTTRSLPQLNTKNWRFKSKPTRSQTKNASRTSWWRSLMIKLSWPTRGCQKRSALPSYPQVKTSLMTPREARLASRHWYLTLKAPNNWASCSWQRTKASRPIWRPKNRGASSNSWKKATKSDTRNLSLSANWAWRKQLRIKQMAIKTWKATLKTSSAASLSTVWRTSPRSGTRSLSLSTG